MGTLRKGMSEKAVITDSRGTFLMWNTNHGISNEHPDSGLTVTHSKADGFKKKKKKKTRTENAAAVPRFTYLFIRFPFRIRNHIARLIKEILY